MDCCKDDKNDGLKINKYPYQYTSDALFEQFAVVGYNDNAKENILQDILRKIDSDIDLYSNGSIIKINECLVRYDNKTLPQVLSRIARKEIVSDDLLIRLIFPTFPIISYENASKAYNVVFAFNSDSIDGKEKNPCYCYSYVFYEKTIFNNLSIPVIYYPKALCVISKYPFYSQFHKLTFSLHSNYHTNHSSTDIPQEIYLFNLIKNTQISLQSNLSITTLSPNHTMSFPLLSGTPIIDYNLLAILTVLPIDILIKINLFSLMEIDMLFFSENIEMLNMTMFSIASLNYPFNNFQYLWNIVSISYEELINPNLNSEFVGKPVPSILGINCSYEPSIDTSLFANHLFIIDIDKQSMIFTNHSTNLNERDLKTIDQIIHIKQYLYKILNEKDLLEQKQSKFQKNILSLMDQLELFKINHKIYNSYYYEASSKNQQDEDNQSFQNIFYSFTINLLKEYYSRFTYDESTISITFNNEPKMSLELNENDRIVYKLLNDSSIYNEYIKQFLQEKNKQCLECHKIPWLFTEEFLHMRFSIELEYNINHYIIIKSLFSNNTTNTIKLNPLPSINPINFTQKYQVSFALDKNIISQCNMISFFKHIPQSNLMKLIPITHIASSIEARYLLNPNMTIQYIISLCLIKYYSLILSYIPIDLIVQYFNSVYDLLTHLDLFFLRKYITILFQSINHEISIRLNTNDKDICLFIGIYYMMTNLITTRGIIPNDMLQQEIIAFNSLEKKIRSIITEEEIEMKLYQTTIRNSTLKEIIKDYTLTFVIDNDNCIRDNDIAMIKQAASQSNYDGVISIHCKLCQVEMYPKLHYINKDNQQITHLLLSPLLLLTSLHKFNHNNTIQTIGMINKIMVNLLFYQLHLPELGIHYLIYSYLCNPL